MLRGLKYGGRGEWVAFYCTVFSCSYLNLASGWSTASAGESHPLPSLNLWNIDHGFFPSHWVWKDISTKCSCHLQNSGWEFHLHVFSPSHKQILDILSSTIDPPDFMTIAFLWMLQSCWTGQGKDTYFLSPVYLGDIDSTKNKLLMLTGLKNVAHGFSHFQKLQSQLPV